MRPFLRRLRRLPSPLPLLFIIIGTIAVILYGRGYRPNLKDNTLTSTGIIATTSDPTGAQVYIDGTLKTATNNSFNIDPGWYTVRISADGYIPWEKKLRVQGEVVTRADAFLFPTNPSLSPITNLGVENPTLSPDGTKIAYIVPLNGNNSVSPKKAGLWIYELLGRGLAFSRNQLQLGTSDNFFNFSQSRLIWSPDSTQIMVDNGKVIRLYSTGRSGDFQDVSASYEFILREWQENLKVKEKQQLLVFKQEFVDMATSSARILAFSPDETKVLYEATASANLPLIIDPPLIGTNSTSEERNLEPNKIYIYDSKEDKNYFVLDKKELPQTSPNPSPKSQPKVSTTTLLQTTNPELQTIFWFPTNKHLVLALEGKIDIMEFDRTNWITVYSGPFIEAFMASWPTGSRIIILTNLNPGVSTLPNLYTVNLR